MNVVGFGRRNYTVATKTDICQGYDWSTHLSVHFPVGVLFQDFCSGVAVPDRGQLPRPPADNVRQDKVS